MSDSFQQSPAIPDADVRSSMGRFVRMGNIEALRIAAMLFILASHFSVHGTILDGSAVSSSNRAFLSILRIGGALGVNVFVMITGYFLSASGSPLRRLKRVYSCVWFYSVVPLLLFLAIGLDCPFSGRAVRCVFPVVLQQWWFVSHYFVLCLFSPFLNSAIAQSTGRGFVRGLAAAFFVFVLLPSTFGHWAESSAQWYENRLAWFFFLYCLGAAIRLYRGKVVRVPKAVWLSVAALGYFGAGLALAWFDVNMSGSQQLPVFAASVSLFLFFLSIDVPMSSFLSVVSKSTFGVYLVHEHPLVRARLWSGFSVFAPLPDAPWFAVKSIVAVLFLYFVLTGLVALSDCFLRLFLRVASTVFSGAGAMRRSKFDSTVEK